MDNNRIVFLRQLASVRPRAKNKLLWLSMSLRAQTTSELASLWTCVPIIGLIKLNWTILNYYCHCLKLQSYPWLNCFSVVHHRPKAFLQIPLISQMSPNSILPLFFIFIFFFLSKCPCQQVHNDITCSVTHLHIHSSCTLRGETLVKGTSNVAAPIPGVLQKASWVLSQPPTPLSMFLCSVSRESRGTDPLVWACHQTRE